MATSAAYEGPPSAAMNGFPNGHDSSYELSTPEGDGSAFPDDMATPLPQMRRPSTTPMRRSSSVRTTSTSRPSVSNYKPGASTDSLLFPRATDRDREHDEPTFWHSVPLLFAIVPAIGGVVFKSGSIILTDLALLILAALYLNWCLVTPWIWYRAAQSVKVIEFRDESTTQDISITTQETEDLVEDAIDTLSPAGLKEKTAATATTPPDKQDAPAAYDAFNELRMHEVMALALCFLGPLLGSYVLHIIRSQLGTLGDQLISNLNLTLFVLCAEIRPLRHGMKMAEARTLYLQRIVKEDPYISTKDKDQDSLLSDLRGRLDELEASCAEKFSQEGFGNTGKHSDNSEAVLKRLQSSTQTQIDALNRAVRRYEKRETTHTMQTESRLQELELRLKETISLAAAAANMSQKPGIMVTALDWTTSLLSLPRKVAYTTCLLPFEILNGFIVSVALRLGVVQARPRQAASKQPVRSKGQANARPKTAKSVA